MKVVVCVVLAIILVNTIKALKSKQVNLALETVLNFDKKDRKADLAVIDKLQNFLDQIKDAMRRRSARRNAKRDVTFTDFILEAAKILKEYDDNDLEDAYVIINDEARKYIITVNAFQDLFGSNDMRRFVSDQLDDAKEIPADKLRHSLELAIKFIETQKKYGGSNDILDIGNTLYDGASDKFVTALRNLYKLRRAGSYNLERILKDTLRSLVFDHYSNLDSHVRGELVNMVKHYWRAFSKNKGKHTRTKLRIPDATPFRHEGKGKRHKHRTNSPTERTHKPYKMQDESSISHEKYIKNTHKNKHEVSLTDNELNKLINNADAPEEEKPGGSYGDQKDNKPYGYTEVKTIPYSKHKIGRAKSSPQLYLGTAKKNDRTEDRYIIKSELSASSEPEILMGGQTIRDIHFRQSSSKQDEASDRAGEETSAEEIVIQHSNIVDIGLSRKTPGRINITFVPSETHKNDGSNEKRSDESISYKVMRKSNVNDTLETDPNPRNYKNVDMLLKKIEKSIEDVKDQVEYVKNITNIIRRDNVDHLSSESTRNITDAKTPKADSGFAFRTQDDSDFTYNLSEVDHDSKKEATENTAATDSTDTNSKTESKISDAVENSSASNINGNKNSDKSTGQKEEDTSQAHDANKDNTKNNTNTTNSVELNRKDNEEHKDESHENTIIEDHENTIIDSNLSSTAKVSLDLNIN